jgi:hypothetical protein
MSLPHYSFAKITFQFITWFTDHPIITTEEYEIQKKTTYEVQREVGAERDIRNSSDMVRAGAKAVANKLKDPDSD